MNVEEERQVRFGRTTIDYGIRRSARRQTVAVAVDPVEGVMLTAPANATAERLDEVVRDKAPWIVDRLRLVAESELRADAHEFVSGESFAYLGRHYRLKVKPLNTPGEAKLDRGFLVVPVSRDLDAEGRSASAERALRDWYIEHARQKLPSRVDYWANRIGVEPPQLVVKDQQKRWGSCDQAGTVRLNWKIIQAPMRLADYVVAHEVVHLLHIDHTKAFWARLGQAMPDYDRRKEELRKLGPTLEW
ncbi:MAG: M48 family metallopeptidase [Nannocystaceae bacterium]|nr:M48 family metallopeptidase [bacterium]